MSSNRDVAASSLRTSAVSGRYGALTGTVIETGGAFAWVWGVFLLMVVMVDVDMDERKDDTS